MNWKNLVKSSVLCFALIGMLAVPSLSQADTGVKKAVYHVDFGDAKRMDATLRNIYNLVNYYTTNSIEYDVRVVSNSAGVQFMITDTAGTKFAKNKIDEKTGKSIKERMQSLADAYDVKFEQCSITLQRTKIDKSKLKPIVGTTSSGQVRLVELEGEGYAYIKVK
jgi:intracellular sulfur oxidation DsrE/DsrF family protein